MPTHIRKFYVVIQCPEGQGSANILGAHVQPEEAEKAITEARGNPPRALLRRGAPRRRVSARRTPGLTLRTGTKPPQAVVGV